MRRYLDVLAGTFMVRALTPWFENTRKRQVKRPKIYFRDSGIYHQLMGISNPNELHLHPKVGASWEAYALEEIIRFKNARPEECFFWGVHSQMELDLLVVKDGKRYGFEIKYSQTPAVKKQHRELMKMLNLDFLTFVCPIDRAFTVEGGIQICGLGNIFQKNGINASPSP